MKPIFSRETVADRRQPNIHWGAVLAGAVVAAGLWNLFQLVFVGGALTAIDSDEIDHIRTFGIGTGVGSMLAPMIAMFVGGVLAGRLAAHYDRRVAGLHGGLVWAITSVIGLVLMATIAGSLTDRSAVGMRSDLAAPPPGTRTYVDDQVRLVNQHLKSQNAPKISVDDFLDAARYSAGGRAINKDAFVSRLDANTKLSRPEAEAALGALGDQAPDAIIAGEQLALHRHQALSAAEDTGNALLVAGIGLLLCLATAIGGAVLGAPRVRARGYERPNTIPGHPVTPAE